MRRSDPPPKTPRRSVPWKEDPSRRALSSAPRAINRVVWVRRDCVPIKGPKPLEYDGCWEGHVVEAIPIVRREKAVVVIVGYTLKIKLSCGTSRDDITIELPYTSPDWKPRFRDLRKEIESL